MIRIWEEKIFGRRRNMDKEYSCLVYELFGKSNRRRIQRRFFEKSIVKCDGRNALPGALHIHRRRISLSLQGGRRFFLVPGL